MSQLGIEKLKRAKVMNEEEITKYSKKLNPGEKNMFLAWKEIYMGNDAHNYISYYSYSISIYGKRSIIYTSVNISNTVDFRKLYKSIKGHRFYLLGKKLITYRPPELQHFN